MLHLSSVKIQLQVLPLVPSSVLENRINIWALILVVFLSLILKSWFQILFFFFRNSVKTPRERECKLWLLSYSRFIFHRNKTWLGLNLQGMLPSTMGFCTELIRLEFVFSPRLSSVRPRVLSLSVILISFVWCLHQSKHIFKCMIKYMIV